MSMTYCAEPGEFNMNHDDAVQLMAVERYLLDELTPTLRDEFEEHMFDCAECSLDLRASAMFMDEAKLQLPQLVASAAPAAPQAVLKPQPKARGWFASLFGSGSGLLSPAFAVPTFAALLLFIGYQNIETIPSLRASAASPRIVPINSFHTGTRGATHVDMTADRSQGLGVVVQLPQEASYTSFQIDVYDQQGKQLWTRTVPASGLSGSGGYMFGIPGAGLEQGSYTLVTTGITAQGARTEVDRHILDVHFD